MSGQATPGPRRTCVSCRRVESQRQLLRLQLDGAALVRVQKAGRGRSAYLHAGEACVRALVDRGTIRGLRRSLRQDVDGAGLGSLVEEILVSLGGQAGAPPQRKATAQ